MSDDFMTLEEMIKRMQLYISDVKFGGKSPDNQTDNNSNQGTEGNMSNARKKRIQANITRRAETFKRLHSVRKPENRKNCFMMFIAWLRRMLGGK